MDGRNRLTIDESKARYSGRVTLMSINVTPG